MLFLEGVGIDFWQKTYGGGNGASFLEKSLKLESLPSGNLSKARLAAGERHSPTRTIVERHNRSMRSDALQRRETILRTARELFAQHGANVAMDVIAERSNVGIGTLYRNFAARPELVEEVTVTTLQEILDAAHKAQTDLPADQHAWSNFLDQLVNLNLGALSEALGTALPSTLSARVLTVQRQCAIAVSEVLEAAKGFNLVRADLNGVELITVIGAATRPLGRAFKDQAPQLQERLVAIMLDGLKPENATALPVEKSL